MNSPDDLEAAFAWLKSEARRVKFGKVLVGVQLHAGAISKILYTIEETKSSSGNGAYRDEKSFKG